MEFKIINKEMQDFFAEITADVDVLYEVEVDKDKMWELYLDSFPAGTNEIYRKKREYDCSCCRHFIKSFGNVVVIKNGEIRSIWEAPVSDPKFVPVLKALKEFVLNHPITNIYATHDMKVGTQYSRELDENHQITTYYHWYLELPNKFVTNRFITLETAKAHIRDIRNVFKRSLDEISIDSVETILELIASNSLYKGEEWQGALTAFLKYKKDYDKLNDREREIFTWEKAKAAGAVVGKIRNHSMGTLLINVSEGMDLDEAVRKYEAIVAPSNYKRPKAIFTQKMLDDAKKTIIEMGYMDSLQRRFARLDDISVNNILFSNKDSAKRMIGGDVFAEMSAMTSSAPKKFSKVEEISVDKFVSEVLSGASEIEAYLENKHIPNMVSLIAPENPNSKTMFKWSNGFSWAYSGNVTDSMKERVKAAGGRVDGDLRFTIQWNEDGKDNCDLDAHCKEAGGYEIYFSTARKPHFSPTKGQLDVDIIQPCGNIAVENITWASRTTMRKGSYLFFVHQFAGSAKYGFRAEIEFDGQVYAFDYNRPMKPGDRINVAEVTLNSNNTFTIKELLPSNISSKEVWGLRTNQFVPVSVICYSPNYWDQQSGIGHRHYFFMLKDCVNPEMPNGMFNEYLKEELMQHKRVFEALGSKMHVNDAEDQLSGIGFSSTKRAELVVKVKGQTERIMKIKF